MEKRGGERQQEEASYETTTRGLPAEGNGAQKHRHTLAPKPPSIRERNFRAGPPKQQREHGAEEDARERAAAVTPGTDHPKIKTGGT